MWLPLNWLVTEFIVGLSTTFYIIPRLKNMFIKKGISGKDMSKNFDNVSEDKIPKIPEAQVSRLACFENVFFSAELLIFKIPFSSSIVVPIILLLQYLFAGRHHRMYLSCINLCNDTINPG